MIKRLWFLGPVDQGVRSADQAWVSGALDAPPEVRPVRMVTCTVFDPDLNDSPHDRIDMAWFVDLEHLHRFDEAVSGNGDGAAAYCSIAAEQLVLRGADWLDSRWSDGGTRLKHIAMAGRADGLTPEEFSKRWKAHAGSAGSTPIPESARGLAYAQNHPLLPQPAKPLGPGLQTCPYDAVNEVWFDDPDLLRERVLWMSGNLPEERDDPLFGARHSVAVEESVLL